MARSTESRGGFGSSPRRRLLAPTVLAVAGAALTLGSLAPAAWAQPRQPGQQQGEPQPDPRTPGFQGPTDDELARLREERRRRIEEARRDRDRENQRERELREMQGLGAEVEGGVDEQGLIRLQISEPISLIELVRFAAEQVDANVSTDPNIANEQVALATATTLTQDGLVALVSKLLEDRGYALVIDDENLWRVTQAQGAPTVFGGEGATIRIIQTPLVQPSALATQISQIIQGGGGAGANVRLVGLDDIGVIVATGAPGALNRVERLVNELLDERAELDLFRFPLDHVAADFAKQRIVELNGELAAAGSRAVRTGGGGAQATAAATAGVSGGSLTNLASRLLIDRGNALIFRGTPAEAEDVADMVRMVDVVPDLEARRYVGGAVTQEIVQAGQALGLGPVTEIDAGLGTNSVFNTNRGFGGATAIEDSTAGSRFVVDPASGSFTYFGTPSQHERVKALTERFKEDAVDAGTQIRVYKLQYARAGDGGAGGAGGGPVGGAGDNTERQRSTPAAAGPGVAQILEQLLEDPQERTTTGRFLPGSATGAAGGALTAGELAALAESAAAGAQVDLQESAIAEALDGTRLVATSENTVIVADDARNQVLIKAPAAAHEQFERIIEALDRPLPQVLVEVQIVSLSQSEDFSFGADVQLNSGQFSFLSTFGVTSPGNTIQDPVEVPAGATGLTTAVIKSDFVPIALRALSTLGDTRIVSSPQILVNDNQQGVIDSIETRPFAQSTQTAGNPVQISQGGESEAGTIVSIRPQISDAKTVILQFEIELSSFLPRASGSNDNLSPPRQEDNYQSIVTVPSDSTIVVGGFRRTDSSTRERKIPILGDLPLIGIAFKDIQEASVTRTVFVFITPRVFQDVTGDGLKLVTEGPLRETSITDGTPELRPAVVPVRRTALPPIDAASAAELGRIEIVDRVPGTPAEASAPAPAGDE